MEENKAQKRISENQVPKLIKMVDEKGKKKGSFSKQPDLKLKDPIKRAAIDTNSTRGNKSRAQARGKKNMLSINCLLMKYES